MDLFEDVAIYQEKKHAPLAEHMRPETWDEFVGQEHIIGPGTVLRHAIENDHIPSMIFWGPPGVGKTSLARLIARMTHSHFAQFSAVTGGVKEVRAIIEMAKKRLELSNKRTILFIDEVHRFNKAQQDAFLPYVEDGTIILIGATTENPSFEVNSALLSRTKVFVLKALEVDQIIGVLKRALSDKVHGFGKHKVKIAQRDLEVIASAAFGDVRTALNVLEFLVMSHQNEKKIALTKDEVQNALQKSSMMYDRAGDEHYNTISAFIKSMRASAVDAAVYYLARMVEAGEDPKFIARRMVIFASEDVGMAQPAALVVANEVFKACEIIGYPECAINLAHGVVYLASAKKDRRAYDALRAAQADVKQLGNLPIPKEILNAPTKLMKNLDYGKGYEQYPEDQSKLLPEKLRKRKYFQLQNSQ